MPKHVVDFLTSIGIPADEATKIDALPEAEQATFDAKPYAEKVKANYQTQFKNDPEFFNGITLENLTPEVKKKLEGGQFARAANIVRSGLIKGLGMTEADYADLPDETKDKLESFVPAIVDKYTKTKAGSKELQEQLIEARKKIEAFGPDYEKNIETKHQTAAEQKVTAAIFNAALIGELSAIPGLKIAAGDIAKTANDILQSKYGFEKVGDFSVELRQKANPQMKVLKANSSQELTLKDALLEIATERGWVEKEKKEGPGEGKFKVDTKDGKLVMVSPHVQDKISKKIAEAAQA